MAKAKDPLDFGLAKEQVRNVTRSTREDSSNAERFARQHSEDACFWPARKLWMVWTGTHWKEDDLSKTMEMAKETARSIYTEAASLPADDGNGGKSSCAKMATWAEQSLSRKGATNMLKMAESLPTFARATEVFDANPWLLNFKNGTVDLRTGELHSHRRSDYITKLANCNFEESSSVLWERFLTDTFGVELLAWIQKAVGYSMTGITTEKVVFIPWGPTDTGKTTFLETIRYVFEEYSAMLQIETLMWTKNQENNMSADLADLRGARFVTTSETEEGQRLREAKLKRITQGMGRIKTARKYENLIEFDETHKLWIDCNHQPMLYGTDDAIWNRLLPIPCTHKLADGEKDRTLRDKLREKMEAIAFWTVRGAQFWYKEGLGRPSSIEEERAEWKKRVDIIGEFLSECCIEEEGSELRATDLYAAFKSFVERAGHHAITATMFGLKMQDRGIEKRRDGSGNLYKNIRLRF